MSNLTTTGRKAKSFWDTSEGTTGMVVAAGALGLLGWGAFKLMPYIANLLENTFYAILFGLLSVGLIYAFVIDGTLRNRLWLLYKLAMRAMTYSIISYDPVGVLRELAKKAWDRINEIEKSRGQVRGQVQQVKNALDTSMREQEKLISEVNYWQERKELEKARLAAGKVGRLKESIARLQVAYNRTQGFYDALTRAHQSVTYIRESLDFEINVVEREYNATNAAHSAWKNVRAALRGGNEFDELEKDTLAFLAEDYANKLGEIDMFMSDAMPFIENVDLQKAMHADEGMKMIDELNSRQFKVDKPKSLENNPSPTLNTINTTVAAGRVEYVTRKNKE
jgi:Holliday junction resolvase-like predicted endonuclease